MSIVKPNNNMKVCDVNAHLHTPYSFSAFDTLTQALDMAATEGVEVVGINDFYSTDGYNEWKAECAKRKLAPMFNIEFISLNIEDQAAGIRVNDPGNPGRTYLSGKGLTSPMELGEPYATMLNNVKKESNDQVKQICTKLNELLKSVGSVFTLDFDEIEKTLTKGSVRERHIAKALRIETYKNLGNHEDSIRIFLKGLFGGKELKSAIDDFAGVENEIRANLLKAGCPAFVAEDPKAFLPMADVCKIILNAGGIPTYPYLADDAKGGYTDFEQDLEKSAKILRERGFYSVEFITTRNDIALLEKYASYLHDQGFVVTLGTEHNTPAMEQIKLTARGGVPLTDRLKQINYEGACVVIAHQDLVESGMQGYVDERGHADIEKRAEFIEYGDKLIKEMIG